MTGSRKTVEEYQDGYAGDGYIYRVVGRGLPRIFYKEYEDRCKAGRTVSFRFHDLVMFFAKAAAEGVIGHFTYDAIRKAIKSIRTPKQEIGGSEIRFEAIVSCKTYIRLRHDRSPGKRGRGSPTPDLEQRLTKEYGLMVRLRRSKKKI
jgi:hypothetical protein